VPAVSYTLLIDNSPAEARLLEAIQQIEVEEHATLASMLRLRLAIDVNQGGDAWNLVDDGIFERLTNLSLLITVGSGSPNLLMNTYVIDSRLNFHSTPGKSTLEVVAMDGTILMSLENKQRAWPNMADSDIATQIFGEYNFTPDVESTQPSRQENDITTIQHGSDIQFLRHLAERNGFECYLETDPVTRLTTGHFHPPQLDETPQGTLSVNMGPATNLESLAVQVDWIQPAEAEAEDIQIGSLSTQEASINSASLTELGRTSLLGSSQAHHEILSQMGLSDTNELQSYVQAAVDRSAWAIRAQGSLDSLAYAGVLRARRPVLVRGVGTWFSGAYYVESVQHLIQGDSYSQHFSLRRNALELLGNEPFGQQV
jgi:phage protein D